MAYNPYYAPYQRPTGYYNPSIPQEMQNAQNPQQMPMQQPQQMQPNPIQMPMNQPYNDMIWVLSQVEAESFPVAPNNSVTLWDKNKDTVYIKSVNMQGVPSIRILDYTERTAENAPKTHTEHVCQCGSKYASKKDFKALQSNLEALRAELEELKAKPKAKTTKIVKTEDENDG